MIGDDLIGDRVRADLFPEGEEVNVLIHKRRRTGAIWRNIFRGATLLAILILSILLIKIFNDTVGLVAEENEISESALLAAHAETTGAPPAAALADLPYDDLVALYAANVSRGRCRAVERQQRFFADSFVCEDPDLFAQVCASDTPAAACALGPRDAAGLQQLIRADVIQPTVVATWNGIDSILNRADIMAEAAESYPEATVYFKSWLSWSFITSPQSSYAETAGIRTAILGTLWVVGIACLLYTSRCV